MGNTTEVKPKLLITEDDFENQKFLQLFLKKYFMVDICDSSESFYKMMGREKYDIILMDISIKGEKNGLDLTREMKSNPDFSEIPVICYTAHAFNKDRINALDAGCDVYLSKPSDIHTLLNALFDLLKLRGKFFLGSNTSQSFVTT
jgi:putative two-component system response regulator